MQSLINWKATKEEFAKKQKEMFEEMKKDFVAESKKIFDKYPTINSIGVPAFTPYFNDGDTCYFIVDADSCMVSINDVREDGIYGADEEEKKDLGVEGVTSEAYVDVANFFGAFPDEFYENVFGDHIEVIVKRDGSTETIDYCHD